MTLTREDPELQQRVEDVAQLVAHLRAGEKPVEEWRVGTEHEKLGLRAGSWDPLPYEGERGLGRLLRKLVEEQGMAPLEESGILVGAEREGARITLEPGGQLELSGAPLRSLHETCKEFRDHIALLKHASAELGIVWVGLGIHPLAPVEQIPWMPRERHRLMRMRLARRGALAHHMMKATGSVQANFDYGDERDMGRKLHLAFAASPLVTALYANSSISDGSANGFLSRRAWIWRHTDPDRCGILPFVFDEGFIEDAYAAYTEWALDVPMLFIQRGDDHLPVEGRTFRAYLERGHGEHRATLADWNLHLTTLFPEARVKRVIETRNADAVPPDLVCALPAFWKGLFYDTESLAQSHARLRHWTYPEVDRLHSEVARRGLEASTPDGPVLAVIQELVDLSAKGLRRIGNRNRDGEDESLFLEPLYEILDRGSSPGRQLLERWEGSWGREVGALVDYASY